MNEYGFDFDFEVDNESTMMGKGMWLLINIFALTFSAMTTGAFFYTYVGDAFEFLFGAWSPYVTAFAGHDCIRRIKPRLGACTRSLERYNRPDGGRPLYVVG